MKFLVATALTLLLTFIMGLYFPWWTVAIAGFIAGLLAHQRAMKAFFASFIGAFLLWAGLAYWIDTENESILSERVGQLLGIGPHPLLLVIITGFVAGLVAGLGALAGKYVRSRPR